MSRDPTPNAQSARAHFERAIALRGAGQPAAALAGFDAAIAADPENAHAYLERGTAHWMLNQSDMALQDYTRAAELAPTLPEAHFNRAAALRAMKRLPEALASLDQGLKFAPRHAGALNTRGVILSDLGRQAEALESLDRAIDLAPGNVHALRNHANVLNLLGRRESALETLDRLIKLEPTDANAFSNRAAVLNLLGRHQEALESAAVVLRFQPDHSDAHYHHGNALKHLGQHEAAAASLQRSFELRPQAPYLQGVLAHARLQLCDWQAFDADVTALRGAVARGETAAPPFALLAMVDDPALQRRAAEIWTADKAGTPSAKLPAHPRSPRLRIGYFSGDFRQHPVATLMAGVFERHDRARFEIFAFSFAPATGDAMQNRLKRAFDRFIDVRASADAAVIDMARSLGIDVAVDLAGHTADGRHGVFAGRAAPVQINYLGYPGTLGSPHTDYIIADNVVIPEEKRVHYSEKVIALPCFQPNDPARALSPGTPTRADAGLPDDAFVFCCFNNAYKIAPATFAGWMRILRAVDKSVLWFSGVTDTGQRNLRAAAARAGISPERLVFAPRVASSADHLARYRCADLFLDTLPYNAHTTASDALWAGLPVLTCPGESYAARVAASLLTALGLFELIAPHQDAYEQLAVALARDPKRLAELRTKLVLARSASVLFDVQSITRSLERAYLEADARHRQGLAPGHLVISPPEHP